jgi:hypothetical protein
MPARWPWSWSTTTRSEHRERERTTANRYAVAVARSADSDLESSIDALYQAPLEQFTADRNALAASLKKTGAKAEAERVKALAKPSTTAWAINQVWWRQRSRFQTMLDAGEAQRKAHVAWAQGRKADVRAAGEARREAVADVTEAAFDVLGGRKAVAPDAQYRISGTIEALASGGVPEGESPGRLTRDLQASGLDALTALADAAGSPARPTIVARGTPKPATPERPAAPQANRPTQVERAKPRVAAAETAADRKARETADAAARAQAAAVDAAETRLAELSLSLDSASGAVKDAAREESARREALEAATRRRTELETALDDARAAEAAARRDVSSAAAAASRAEMDRGRAAKDVERAREALERLRRGR